MFLFRWSIDQGIVGPLARVAIGASASTGMIGIGFGLSSKRPLYARLPSLCSGTSPRERGTPIPLALLGYFPPRGKEKGLEF